MIRVGAAWYRVHMNDIQPVPERSGTSQNGQNTAPYADKEWLTINEAVILFRHLGLPRTPEAIRKYCRQEKIKAQMVAGAKGEQHMIEQSTIKPFVDDQLRALSATSQTVPEHDGTSRNIPVHSVTTRNVPEQPDTEEGQSALQEQLEKKVKEIEGLKRENRELEIDKEVRSRMNEQLEKANERLFDQFMEANRETQQLSRKYGQLEERVRLQLEAGGNDNEAEELGDEGRGEDPYVEKQSDSARASYTIHESREERAVNPN